MAVRPIYEPTVAGKILLWVFYSQQLRVIVDENRPWLPKAVIERLHPFAKNPGQVINVWTAKHFVQKDGKKFTVEAHGMGRIPHVFVRDELSYTSFFVEGRGRRLCEPNAILNNDLSDFEEVKQMQGFSVLEIINAKEDNVRIGPREGFKFEPQDNDVPFGVNFKSPNAPLGELGKSLDDAIRHILMVNDVPVAALGAAIDQRQLSGEAIRAAMQPIIDDMEERAAIFEPIEWDLADSMLRVVTVNERGQFRYNPATERPEFDVKYQGLEFPKSTADRIRQDEFDVATGKKTPAQLMRRDDPDAFPTEEDALSKWTQNLDETATAGFDRTSAEPTAGELEILSAPSELEQQ